MPSTFFRVSAFCTLSAFSLVPEFASALEKRQSTLEEVTVTAQKRAEDLQSTPIAISVLSRDQLEARGIVSMQDLEGGAVPSLRVMSAGFPPSTLVMAIRGNGPVDMNPVTREPTVGVYIDGFYLSRPQGLNVAVPDLERIEVLRGPQGTLFGRNTMAGAVNFITRKPTGQFGFEQTVGFGNYDAWKTITRLNLPEYAGFRAKIDYVHDQRDGWVKNPAPGQDDYDAYQNDGGRLTLNYSPSDSIVIDYAYDKSRSAVTDSYLQIYTDLTGIVGNERDRETHTRAPIPLRPTYIYQSAHSLTATWDASESLTVKSLTGYRQLTQHGYSSYGASIFYNGSIETTDDNESQFSQEVQLIGTQKQVNWVTGLYYFRSHADQFWRVRFALDTGLFGNVFPENAGKYNVPIDPPVDLGVPSRKVRANTESDAFYGQLTYTPPVLGDRLHLTGGVRYTQDRKDGNRIEVGYADYDLNTNHWDTLLTIDYSWTDTLSTYLKRATGYRSGSVNPRSASFMPYDPDTVLSWEAGVKSEFLNRRIRMNADVFRNNFDDMQFDFVAPVENNPNNTETINASRRVRVQGAELELTVMPVEGLVVGLSYTYLDSDMPPQPNPFLGGALQQFELTQTPRNAGALAVDYTFSPSSIGTFSSHLDVTSTSGYARQSQDVARQQGYTLLNARLTLSDIPLDEAGSISLSAWGKNLTNYKYAMFAFPMLFGEIQNFGDPRTFGVDVTYKY